MKKKIIAVVVALVLIIGGGIGYAAIPVGASKDVEKVILDTQDGAIRVGIMSDSQLGQEAFFQGYLEDALDLFKTQKVNMILNMGDYTDTALKENYAGYRGAFDSVYGEEKPIVQSVMGNHDYWLPDFVKCWRIPFKGTLQRRFMKNTGESSPWTHKVVNGYHFIAASPSNGGMDEQAYAKKIDWLREQIELAVKDDASKPIFVLTHSNPKDTVYMSEDKEGCKNLDELFSQYPQVVSISGHSHAPLMDAKSIYQKNYTALNTQCLSYVCFAEGDADVVQDNGDFISEVPMAMIMTIADNRVTFDRYDVISGELEGGEWSLDLPVTKHTFTYTDEIRSAQSPAPVWPESFQYSVTKGKDADGKETDVLNFTAAVHPIALRYYEVCFTDAEGKPVEIQTGDKDTDKKTTLRFMSDYARMPDSRAETASFALPAKYRESLPAGTYTVTVKATDSFGNLSEAQTMEIVLL